MRITHAIAIAAAGWYLAAPTPSGGFRTFAGYDRAEECAAQLRIDREVAFEAVKSAEGRQSSVAEYAASRDDLRDAIHERCIASDDPRLKR